MNKFKIPALIAAAVLVISAAALFIFIKKDAIPPEGDEVNAPAWIHEEGSSGKLPISDSVDLSPKVSEKKDAGKTAQTNKTSTTDSNKPVKQTAATPKTETPLAKTTQKLRDKIVTEVFLENLADYIADNYQPTGSLPHRPDKGYSSASFKSIITYFGLNLHGLMLEAKSIETARKAIWTQLLSAGTLSSLYDTYSDNLLNLIEEKGILAERSFAVAGDAVETRELTTSQRAEMFRTSAVPLRHVAAVLTAIAENNDIVQAMDSFIKAQKRVESANAIFQLDLHQSRNSDSTSAQNKAVHSGQILKDAITVREKIKNGISQKIKAFCTGPCETPDDAFYISQWFFRRVKENDKRIEGILSGVKSLNSLARKMEKRADLIKKAI